MQRLGGCGYGAVKREWVSHRGFRMAVTLACQVANCRRYTPGGSALGALQRKLDFYVAVHNMSKRPGDGPFHLT
jgi:hypothetical protein